ncbi:cytochrome P450 [Fodinicola acaciae]|uniref:cytochrome P450 n=1 Tax=Fodinicola acaciae TaxID=2681555 RepID=UPI0013CFFDA4|nr:cytochrome P450 [Fodinicola acaciae]
MTQTDLPEFPVTRGCPYRPPSGYQELREQGPVSRVRMFDGTPVWLVTGYDEVRSLLADPRLSSDRSHDNFPIFFPAQQAIQRARDSFAAVLIATDPPEHGRQRRMVIPSFAVRRIAALKPGIQRIVDSRIAAMREHGGPVDLVRTYALPIPSMVICELLGVPYADHEFFEEQARLRLDPEKGHEAIMKLYRYLDELVAHKEKSPGDGLLDDLIAEQLAEGKLDRREVVSFAVVLLIAGHDTTANVISLGTFALLENPAQLAALRADPSKIPDAVEELLRYVSLVSALPRVAVADIEVGGETIHAGDGLLIALAAANHSDEFVQRPAELDVDRADRHHVAFGYGVHQCLGQNLARAELEIAFGSLLAAFPDLRLAVPADEVEPRSGLVAGVVDLPVTW